GGGGGGGGIVGGPGGNAEGGGVFATGGSLTMAASSVTGNAANSGKGGNGGKGGGGGAGGGGGSPDHSNGMGPVVTAYGGGGGDGGFGGTSGYGGNGGNAIGGGLYLTGGVTALVYSDSLPITGNTVGNSAGGGVGPGGGPGGAGGAGGGQSTGKPGADGVAGQAGGSEGYGSPGTGYTGSSPNISGSVISPADTITPLTELSAATISSLPGVSTGSVLLATFTQGSATQDDSTYTALVDWGDGQLDISTETNPPVHIQVSGQTISVYGSHTYTVGGTFNLSVTLFTNDTEATANPAVKVATDVTGQMQVERSGLGYNRFTDISSGTITLTNNSSTPLTGELEVVFSDLPADVTLQNPSGYDANGDPYLLAKIGTLAPGASVTLAVQFYNPKRLGVNYDVSIFEAASFAD
ncbi:MAG: hypothetical protein ACRELG_08375, partial [Gemmataceae bacterium]